MYEEEIKQLGMGLQLDESARGICPFCNAKHEKSFVVRNTNAGLIYWCYRAKCGAKGIVGGRHLVHMGVQEKIFKPKVYDGHMQTLPSFIETLLWKRYELPHNVVYRQGFSWTGRRLYMPIFDYRGYVIGGQAKALHPNVKPKAITYQHVDAPLFHYPLLQEWKKGPLVIVEDILSAVKISYYTPVRVASLLGTHFSAALINQLLKTEPEIYLMLDSDATALAIEHQKDYGSAFRNFTVVPLSNGPDPKDIPEEQLKQLLIGRGICEGDNP